MASHRLLFSLVRSRSKTLVPATLVLGPGWTQLQHHLKTFQCYRVWSAPTKPVMEIPVPEQRCRLALAARVTLRYGNRGVGLVGCAKTKNPALKIAPRSVDPRWRVDRDATPFEGGSKGAFQDNFELSCSSLPRISNYIPSTEVCTWYDRGPHGHQPHHTDVEGTSEPGPQY